PRAAYPRRPRGSRAARPGPEAIALCPRHDRAMIVVNHSIVKMMKKHDRGFLVIFSILQKIPARCLQRCPHEGGGVIRSWIPDLHPFDGPGSVRQPGRARPGAARRGVRKVWP